MSGTATANFNYFLNRLPLNHSRMASDASTSFGMAGIIRFDRRKDTPPFVDGLFWQIAWDRWDRIFSTRAIPSPRENINTAEYLALLITCETFANQAAGRITYMDVDNRPALAWFEAARCPIFPFDRCGQGTHLYLLERNMKVRAKWIRSASNTLADRCSRKMFSLKRAVHEFDGVRLMKVKPRWQNVMRFV